MPRLRFNAFSMNCVSHIHHGQWVRPDSRSVDYTDLDAWIEPFLAELIAFPGGQHDDQVDAFADAFNDLAVPVLPGQGLLDLLTRQAASS